MIPNLFTKRQVNIYKYIIFFRKYELLAVVRLLKKKIIYLFSGLC